MLTNRVTLGWVLQCRRFAQAAHQIVGGAIGYASRPRCVVVAPLLQSQIKIGSFLISFSSAKVMLSGPDENHLLCCWRFFEFISLVACILKILRSVMYQWMVRKPRNSMVIRS